MNSVGFHFKNEGREVVYLFNYGLSVNLMSAFLEISATTYSRSKTHPFGRQEYVGNVIFFALFPIVYVALILTSETNFNAVI